MIELKPITNAMFIAGLLSFSALADAAPRADLAFLSFPGVGYVSASSINATGQTTGAAYGDSSGSFAFLSANGVLQNLGTLGSAWVTSTGINSLGQVVGYGQTSTGSFHAFAYTNSVMHDLGTMGGTDSYGYGINDIGQVVGATTTASGETRAFVYSNGTMQSLGTLGSYGGSYGSGINNVGQVAGYSTANNGYWHAFRYSGGAMQDLGTLGGNNSVGLAINAGGQVVGYSENSSNNDSAFIYTNGVMQNLGTLGGTSSYANAINTSGQVVGRALNGSNQQRATLWNNGIAYDLSTLAPSGSALYGATSINDLAQVVVDGYVLTLHPDWQGGSGNWSDSSHWNFAGMGSFGINPGAPHDVVINPTGTVTVTGPAEATIKSLSVFATGSNLVTLNLNYGSIAALNGTNLGANGRVVGNGQLVGDLAIQSGGRVFVHDGESMLLAGQVANRGKIDAIANTGRARLEIGGALVNAVGGQFNLQNADVLVQGTTTNTGRISIAGVSSVSGVIDNQAGGQVNVSGTAGDVTFWDNLHNNGSVSVTTGSTATFFGLVNGAGNFIGGGTKNFAGGYAPGNSPALTTMDGPVEFSSGALTMELAGTTPGSGYDKTVFGGKVTLSGAGLDVVNLYGWTASAGQTYDLFDWNGGLTGSFSSVSLPGLANGLRWNTSALYTTGSISVAAVPEPETYAMLLAGLGLIGAVARRRRANMA